jgi:hypothetical protein
MKKLAVCLLTGFFFSCLDGDKTTTTNDTDATSVPVENVNGNLPDTTNSVSPVEPERDSSIVKDTTRK